MKKIKGFILDVCLILGVAIILAAMPTEEEGAIYEDTVRLHILANSDSESDQRTKYEIRDLLLDEYGQRLSRFESKEEAAEAVVKCHLSIWEVNVKNLQDHANHHNNRHAVHKDKGYKHLECPHRFRMHLK